ncbi:MBL fold metallo-hydrolase [Alloalcanivorax venustensis]|jgi:glyoxylase-like metal-dependent hydrolase (beta-lactamase superfamily II)|uniref:Metallo-beta-lactamase family protein n=1 Tax=Alloalcanivorax venustensis ISO4 TaxID=1177184 RepID=A0ABS0AJ85_9GAMM|nr:MBL fold metallo-hydrolase [Alloalcanivorax venustensis]KXJ47594.1 MAG: MBL fold metallo-hydrolase [Alcanivorax sp. Nap_24]MAK22000.1 MBL fold metallo-hydrolase [Alcanivorax sp.]MED5600998.1 MBL fold metallo-hydrolase [Pseudomonadota bacterium]SMO81601.1 Glyoxylase, beta-lactamase superfamily II [Alcanivorax sp. DSM 26295]MAQ35364.1 MBL fold metallo-hydrolase [Alcanivorax sp.]|tara:strand:+ start:9608 stop:10489 length:882 start_codon:yes stop_codon:yes gene_type:complete
MSPSAAGIPQVESFFDPVTNTVSYVVIDPQSRRCALVDSVLDYDAASGHTSYAGAQKLVDFVRAQNLTVDWLLETHVHADHLSAAPWLQEQVGGKLAIGDHIRTVQHTFGKVFNAGTDFARDGSQFDHLFHDGDRYQVGELQASALHTPGHTPACMSHLIGDALFVGDTLFMPDYGTARCDFPGGDARTLYRSIRKLLALPDETRVFLCHDYLPEGRDRFCWQTTIGEQRRHNIHVHEGISEAQFVAMREERDATLGMPRLILPSVQVNMRAGHLPPPEDNGVQYMKIPLNRL